MWKYRRGRLASHFAYAPCPVFESVFFFARHPLITQHVSRLWSPQIMQKSCQVETRSSGSVSISTRLPETHENPRRSHNSRAFIGRKNRFGTGQGDDVIDDCCVISPAAQHRNATVNWLTGHTFSPILASIWPILTRDGSFWWEDEGQFSNDIALMIKSRRPYANEERKYASLASSRFYA